MNQKIHINVGTIGHVDHGKTTLTAALSLVMAHRHGGQRKAYDQIDSAPQERASGITINASHVLYESASRRYAHIDCPGHEDYVKNMITGASQMDGAVLLVDGSQGPQAQTREHVILARQVGVEHLVVFVNKVDIADPELLDLVCIETVELLEQYGYEDVPIVTGSALLAMKAADAGDFEDEAVRCIDELVRTMDEAIPAPDRDREGPFLMPIEGVFSVKGRGTVVTGRVERGVVRVGDAVQLVGRGQSDVAIPIKGIQAFHRDIPAAEAGLNVGLNLRGVDYKLLERGVVAVTPGSVKPRERGEAEIYLLRAEEGGRHKPFGSGYMPQLWFGATDVTGTLLTDDTLDPGAHARVRFELAKPIALEAGMRFAMREGGRTIGAGVVKAVE